MKPLAVSGNKRIPGVNVPTLLELGVNVTAANWRGVFGAPGINDAQRDKLVDLMTRVHASGGFQRGRARILPFSEQRDTANAWGDRSPPQRASFKRTRGEGR
jgi:tripartite-type tricarboxylate transporter receptor subunit TctC